MADIKLKEAAKYYGEEPHQVKAWDWLEGKLTGPQLEGFQKMYRNEVGGPNGLPPGQERLADVAPR